MCAFHDVDCDYDPDMAQDFVFAAKGKAPTKFMKKRAGAKAVKAFERAANAQGLLEPEDATTFRALSSRGNYLAQDRPDGTVLPKNFVDSSQPQMINHWPSSNDWGATMWEGRG